MRYQPLVLHARDGSRGERVVVCSPAARQSGARPNMPLAEAAALVQHKHDTLHTIPYEPAADREALEELAAWCEQFSPLVGLEDAAEPTCLLLDITGVAMLFGGQKKLLAKIARRFGRRGYHVQLGLGETIGQAWAAAHCGAGKVAEFARSQPEAEKIRSVSNCCEFGCQMSALPAGALRLPAETLELLDELGITTIAQLQALPRGALASRFGDLLVKRLNQFEGRAKEVIIAHRGAEPFTASWSLEHPTDRREMVEQVLDILIDRLSAQLDEQDRGAVQMECCIRLVDRPSLTFTVGLYRPTACPRHLSQLVQLQLENRRWPGLVSVVRLQAVTTAPLEVIQGELFPDRQRERKRQLALLVDRLSSRLGRDRVLTAQPQSDALPERAVALAPTVEQRSTAVEERKTRRKEPSRRSPPPAPRGLQRPLKLHDPPIPIEALAVAPDGPPQRFQFHRRRHTIARQWGPERIETSWWRGRIVRRDYWRIETTTGHRFWLFRRLDDGEWFLHGDFV